MAARNAAVGAIITLLCAACVPWPHHSMLHPGATFRVRDRTQKPISGARIALSSRLVWSHDEHPDTNVVTNDSGVARVMRAQEWHWYLVVVPDGEAPLVWKWCADAPGYQSDCAELQGEPRDTIRITLARP